MDLVAIFTILGAIAALVSVIYAVFINRGPRGPEETRQYFTLGATLAKLGYHKVLRTEEREIVETLRVAFFESARRLDLSPELRVEVETFLQSPRLTSDELPDLRNKITRSINISINPNAATTFYLGFNVINLLMLSQLGAAVPSLDQQASAIPPFKTVLAEVIRDSQRVGIPVRKLRRLEGLPTNQPGDYFAHASTTLSRFLDRCEKVMGRAS